MLVLTRKYQEKIRIGDNITITYPYSATTASCSGQVSVR